MNKSSIWQIARFCLAGTTTVAIDFLTFFFLVEYFANFTDVDEAIYLAIANTISLLAGFLVSFTLNKFWVFKQKDQKHVKNLKLQLLMYTLLFLFNIGFATFFVWAVSGAGLNTYFAKVLSIMLITLWNFIIYRKVIFKIS